MLRVFRYMQSVTEHNLWKTENYSGGVRMIIIGEKLNGAIPSIQKAITEKDGALIRERAKLQADAGADFIDVHASRNEGETEILGWMIEQVQEVTDVPVCIDSPDPKVCVEAMKYCRKEGLINSVSMEKNKTGIVFPAIADTGWECVALLCSDKYGIPQSVDQRMEVMDEIMEEARKYGISPDRLHIDPLVEAIATNEESFHMFSECCRRIREKYPEVHITSGLSNISFGLPSRKTMNLAFLGMAVHAGMDSAILDPANQDMRGMIHAAQKEPADEKYQEMLLVALGEKEPDETVPYARDLAGMKYAAACLNGEDDFCLEYIDAYNEGEFGVKK